MTNCEMSLDSPGVDVNHAIEVNRSRDLRRRRQLLVIIAVFAAAFLILGAFALVEALRNATPNPAGDYLVAGAVGLAIGLVLAAFAVAMFYRRSWFGSWATSYGDAPGLRWAISPTAEDQERVLCPKCDAPNLRVSPACWKCGYSLMTGSAP